MAVLPLLGCPSPSLCWYLLDMLENPGPWGDTQSRSSGAPSSLSEAAPPRPTGDILALVFGILFAVTSIAFLVQMRRQHRYVLHCPLPQAQPPLPAWSPEQLHANHTQVGSPWASVLIRLPCHADIQGGPKGLSATTQQRPLRLVPRGLELGARAARSPPEESGVWGLETLF